MLLQYICVCLFARVFNLLKLIYKTNKPVTSILVGPITGPSFKTLLITTREFQGSNKPVTQYLGWTDHRS